MCGIAGSFGHLDLDQEQRDRILDSLTHRGPDGRSVARWPDAALFHTRLRIIDLSRNGDQPMPNEDGSIWTIFNGEIYNHRALRTDLEARGHRFRGRSDTEVLPHLYEEYGNGMFSRLCGMFSAAILDRKRRRLLLGRDRFGIKPLFYAEGDGFLAFASEIPTLRLVPGVDLEPDAQAIADFAALLFVPAPRTIHRGISALLPGTFLDCQLLDDGRVGVKQQRFHSFSVSPNTDLSLEEAIDRAEPLVERAVVSQLESDVPLGALLSGGIDSSLVSFFAQRNVQRQLLTFNVRFAEESYDETSAAETVAREIGSDHRTLDMDGGGGSWDAITDLLCHAGQPFADTSLFAVDGISRAMREHVTVALSGDGGDEGFGGYSAYWQVAAIDRLRRAPTMMWRAGALLLDPLGRLGVVRPTLGARARDLTGADDASVVQTIFSWVREREHRELLVDAEGVEPLTRLFEPQWQYTLPPGTSRLERLSAHTMEVNIRLILADDYLAKVDTASMRHSLEVRVPMLDEDLIGFGLTLPHKLRVAGRTGKRVLRGVARRTLPATISERPKQGFEVPVDRWTNGSFASSLREFLLDRDSRLVDHLNDNVYTPWIHAFSNGGRVEGVTRDGLYQRVIMLLSLELALRGSRVPS